MSRPPAGFSISTHRDPVPSMWESFDVRHGKGRVPLRLVTTILEESQCTVDVLMRQLVPIAAVNAEPPISQYFVGAVARGGSGALYLGWNLEFPGLSLATTIHAEEAAILNAWDSGETTVTALAVNRRPCGHCRQFLTELDDGASLLILDGSSPAVALQSLLADAISPERCGVTRGLLGHGEVLFSEELHPHDDRLLQLTWQGARSSYAPYAGSHAALSLETTDGTVVTGRTAESAAFNPTMTPGRAAFALLSLAGYTSADIHRAMLVDVDAPVDHRGATQTLLDCLAPGIPLEHRRATLLQTLDVTAYPYAYASR